MRNFYKNPISIIFSYYSNLRVAGNDDIIEAIALNNNLRSLVCQTLKGDLRNANKFTQIIEFEFLSQKQQRLIYKQKSSSSSCLRKHFSVLFLNAFDKTKTLVYLG